VGSTVVTKGVIFAVNMLYVPIVIRHLGAGGFGVWMTISTTLTMLLVLDLGGANSLTNFISEAFANGDQEHARRYMTTALTLMVGAAAGIGLAAYIGWPYINLGRLFNIQAPLAEAEVSAAVAVALVIFLVDLPARLAAKVLGGYQELTTANLFAMIGSLASLAVMPVLVYDGAGRSPYSTQRIESHDSVARRLCVSRLHQSSRWIGASLIIFQPRAHALILGGP